MTEDEAQEKAEKIQALSVLIYKVAHTLEHMKIGMEMLTDELFESSLILKEVVKDLPPEVQKNLKSIVPGHESIEVKTDDENDSLVNWIRRVLKGGK